MVHKKQIVSEIVNINLHQPTSVFPVVKYVLMLKAFKLFDWQTTSASIIATFDKGVASPCVSSTLTA